MTDHWTDDINKRRAFHIMAYQALGKAGLIPILPECINKPWHDEAYNTEIELFKEGYDIKQAESAAEAMDVLKEWAKTNAPKLEHSDNVAHVSVTVTRHYGDMSISYGLEANYFIQHYGTLALAYKELREVVEAQHDLAAQNRPALMPASQLQEQMASGTRYMDILCTHVRKEFVDGKYRIRLIGGEFTKHGVAVYDEYMSSLLIDPDALEMGDTAYEKKVRIQLDQKGNPKRAIEIV